ncbi:S8 family peptidase [Amycolatopsis sp. NPDC059657]|uniref:S8 family peptidase n=1 Tax=Amycolatopsis sp. NPDC059657 TaxID=3346899 RepID=UPI0036705912
MSIRPSRGLFAVALTAAMTLAAVAPAQADVREQANPPAWGLDRIDQAKGVDSAYHYETRAENVTVYIIDSGVDATIADFGGRVEQGKDFLKKDSVDTADTNGHGTQLAGVVGGKSYGVAKGAAIVPVRVIGADGTGLTENLLAGIDWTAKNAKQPAVALLGIAGVPNDALDAAVKRLAEVMPVVVPAGGDSADVAGLSPARVPEVLTVGSSDKQDRVSATSDFGPGLDLYAPGVDIAAPRKGGQVAGSITGTSIAAAHVAGAAALYRSLNPEKKPAEVAQGLVDNATKNALSGVPEGTANRLLYTLTPVQAPDPGPVPPLPTH